MFTIKLAVFAALGIFFLSTKSLFLGLLFAALGIRELSRSKRSTQAGNCSFGNFSNCGERFHGKHDQKPIEDAYNTGNAENSPNAFEQMSRRSATNQRLRSQIIYKANEIGFDCFAYDFILPKMLKIYQRAENSRTQYPSLESRFDGIISAMWHELALAEGRDDIKNILKTTTENWPKLDRDHSRFSLKKAIEEASAEAKLWNEAGSEAK